MLEMEDIAAISAPAATVLGWADINKLEQGLKKSLGNLQEVHDNPILDSYLKRVKQEGIHSVALDLQKRLSEKWNLQLEILRLI